MLWPVGINATENRWITLLLFVSLVFVVLGVLARKGRGLYVYRLLPGLIAIASAFGVVFRLLVETGVVPDSPATWMLASLGMEVPYFLMPVWASFLLTCKRRSAICSVAIGIVLAGVIQVLLSVLLGGALSYVLACLLAPISCAVLWRFTSAVPAEAEETPLSAPAVQSDRKGGTAPEGISFGAVGVMLALVAVSSFVVYIIHSQWIGIQDSGPASLLVQICAGCGVTLTGGLLYVAAGRLDNRSLVDFCFFLILPVAVAGLYLSEMVNGVTLAVSAIPLNIVYATLLFFVWVVPLAVRVPLRSEHFSLVAFFLKRAGVLVAPLVMATVSVLGIELVWLTFGSVATLIALSVLWYLMAHGQVGAAGKGSRQEDGYLAACSRIAEQCRLTPRERDVFELLGRGRTAKHIAQALGMSDATVKTHTAHIYRKLGVNSQQEVLDLVEHELSGEASTR